MLMQMQMLKLMLMQLGNGNGHGDGVGVGDEDGVEVGVGVGELIRFVPKWPFGKSVLITSQKRGKTKTVLTGKRPERSETSGERVRIVCICQIDRGPKGFSLGFFQLTASRRWGREASHLHREKYKYI